MGDWSNLIKFPWTLDSDNLGGPEGLCSHCNNAVEWGLDLQHASDVQIRMGLVTILDTIQSCLPLDVESKSPAAAAGCGPDSEPGGGGPKLFWPPGFRFQVDEPAPSVTRSGPATKSK